MGFKDRISTLVLEGNMEPVEFEVRSGRPTQVVVADENGKKWTITCSLSIINVVPKGTKNADGSPEFDLNFGIAFQTKEFEAK
jgi:hypothetical protein